MEQKDKKYSTAIKRLEEIVDNIENNRIDIDELVPMLKEAKELVAFCNEKLQKAEKEINEILDPTNNSTGN